MYVKVSKSIYTHGTLYYRNHKKLGLKFNFICEEDFKEKKCALYLYYIYTVVYLYVSRSNTN